ncbi:33683_t:CDS:2, partial [Gigaspora margarita]
MAKLEHEKSTSYEYKVRAYLDSQGMVKLEHTKLTSYECKVHAYLDCLRPAEEVSPIITSPPNLQNRTNELSNSAEVEDGLTEAPLVMFYSFHLLYYAYKFISNQHFSLKSNDHYESDAGIARKSDNNPFIAQTEKDSMKNK